MKVLRKAVAADRVGYHPEHIMRLARQGKFPQPVMLGPRTVAFVEEEVNAWLKERIAERDAGIGTKRPAGLRNRAANKVADKLAKDAHT